jgi:hypothetical protein
VATGFWLLVEPCGNNSTSFAEMLQHCYNPHEYWRKQVTHGTSGQAGNRQQQRH